MHRRIFLGATVLAAPLISLRSVAQSASADTPPQIGQISKDSVWVPTPDRMIRRMMQMADVTRDDLVIDLGSGDGRIPIHAARHFGARAIGVELEPNLVRLSIDKARAEGVGERARFLQQDLFQADLSQATVIALYISPGVMTRLRPILQALKPGTRVVSHHFTLEPWEPDETMRVENRMAYLWVVPADVRGEWAVSVAGQDLTVRIGQNVQMLTTTGERAGRAVNVIGARLRGTEIRFTAFDHDGHSRQFEGQVDGTRMRGTSGGEGIAPLAWSAVRR
ncbi:MAG: class I SAM-dependent methyltransferase [Burkholderiales bacterium]|nr:class I SAM-dependent methyltransferase [Burkholderiales bacterium]